jgi:predicted DNA-binding protein
MRLEKLTHTCGCNHCESAPPEVSQFIEDLEDVYRANNMLQVIRLLNENTFTLDEAAEKIARISQLEGASRHQMRSAAPFPPRDHDK